MAQKQFVKSADTRTQVSSSKAELEKMLRRYGATGMSVNQTFTDSGTPIGAMISFIVPDSLTKDAAKVPVSMPVDIRRVYDALYGRPMRTLYNPFRQVFNPNGYDAKKLEQAERVAWRNLIVWVDAALSSATAGLQTITESLFVHTVAQVDGRPMRMMDVIEQAQGQLPAGVRALLSAPAEVANDA